MADDNVDLDMLRCSLCYKYPNKRKCFSCSVADEIERLRAAGDALAKQITKPCRCVEAHDGAINETCAPCAAFFDWEEARRG